MESPQQKTGVNLSVNSISIDKLKDTFFYQFRDIYPQILLKQNAPSEHKSLYLGLYETALACAMLVTSYDKDYEELEWIVNNDELLFEACRFVYCTTTLMLMEHMSEDDVIEIVKPIVIPAYGYLSTKLETKEKSLGDALNPHKRITESHEFKKYMDLNDYLYNDKIPDEDNGTYLRFSGIAMETVYDRYDSEFLCGYFGANGKNLHKSLYSYLLKYAQIARKDINRKLIRHFSN